METEIMKLEGLPQSRRPGKLSEQPLNHIKKGLFKNRSIVHFKYLC